MIKSIVETGFNYWNFYVGLEAPGALARADGRGVCD